MHYRHYRKVLGGVCPCMYLSVSLTRSMASILILFLVWVRV
jgi:hypothetical protein